MGGKLKKILSILLIIAMVMTSAGFGTFADSIDDMVTTSSQEEKSSSKFYGEVGTNESDSTKTFDESITIVDEEKKEDETTTVEEPEEEESTTVEEPEEDETTTAKVPKEEESTTVEESEESATFITEESSEDESTSVTETTTKVSDESEETTKELVAVSSTINSSNTKQINKTEISDEENDTADTASDSTLDQPSKLPLDFEDMQPTTTAPLFGSGTQYDIHWILTPGDWVSDYVASTSYIEGEALPLPSVDKLEVPAHYIFNGWKIDDIIVTEIPDTQVGEVYVVADFERITHAIHWTLTPGDWASGYVASTSYIEGVTFTLPGVDKLEVPAHYRFNGWKMGTGTTYVTEIPDTEIDEVYITADFEKITHNIIWHLNNNNQGWIAGFVASTSYIEGEVFTLHATTSVVELVGHYLDHWELNGLPATIVPSTFTTDVDIYAIWEEKTYTIEYYENINSTVPKKVATRSYSEAYNLDLQPIWTVEGYKFLNWLNMENDEVVLGVFANSAYNLKVYSMWVLDDAGDYPLPTDIGTVETLSSYWFSDGTYNPDYTRAGGTKRYTITELSFVKGDEHCKPKDSLESWKIVMRGGGQSHCIAHITAPNKVVIWIPPDITPLLGTKEGNVIKNRSANQFIAYTSWFGAGYLTYYDGWARRESANWPHIAMENLEHVYGLNHVLFNDMHITFSNCTKIKELSLVSFFTSSTKHLSRTFQNCDLLETIYCNYDLKSLIGSTGFDNTFTGCTSLIGENGTGYISSKVDGTYAKLDEPGSPGYFTAPELCNVRYYTNGVITPPSTTTYFRDDTVRLSTYSDLDIYGAKFLRWEDSNGVAYDNNNIEYLRLTTDLDLYGVWEEYEKEFNKNWYDYIGVDKSSIKKINIVRNKPMTYTESYKLDNSNGITAYLDGDELYINVQVINGSVVKNAYLPSNVEKMFGDFENLEEVNGLEVMTSSVSNASRMFENCDKLQSVTLPDNFANELEDASYMFNNCANLTNVAIDGDFDKVENMSHMFASCSNLVSVDLRRISTKSVTNIEAMFEDCTNLTNILVPDGFGSNITNASKVFHNCKQMSVINLGNFSLEKVENIESLFEGCENLSLVIGENVATFSNLQTSKRAFKGCSSLIAFSFDIFDTPALTNAEEMFEGCSNLRTILVNENFTGLTTLTHTDNMFKDCVNLVGGQGFAYDPNATNGDFARIDYGGIMPGYYTLDNPAKYEEIQFTVPIDWFHSLTKNKDDITEIRFFNDAPPIGGGSAIGAYDEMFYINQSYNNTRAYIENTATGSIVKFHYGHSISKLKVDGDASGFFKDFTSLKVVEGLEDKVDVTNVTDISELFSGCTSLEVARLNPNTENVTEMDKVFYGCENLREVHIGSNLKLNKVTNLESAFEGCKKLTTLDMGIASFSSVQNLKNAFKDCESLTLFSFDICDTPTLATTSGMFSGCKNLRKIYVNDNFQGLQHIAYDNMFDGCVNLIGGEGFTYSPTVPACKSGEFARVDYGGIMPGYYTIFNTAKYHDVVFDLETDWYKATSLPKEEVKKIKFFNASQAEGGIGAYDEMFYMSDTDKTRVYVEASTKTIKFHYGHDIDTLKFQGDVEGMFAGFTNLEEMEGIEKLDASRIVNMSAMFAGCKSMKHLTIPNGLINATTFSEAFKDCSSLETVTFGSDVEVKNVTTLDGMFENCTSLKSIDFGTSFDISKVTTMERMFKNCESLTEIKLNQKLSSGNIESMREMFMGCSNLTSEGLVMPLASLDVRNVKDMGYMFASCSNISTINLSGIEANKLDTMEYMFAGCENLENIKFGSTFDTSKVTNMSHMFEGCKKLKGTPTSKLEPSENNTKVVKSVLAKLFGDGDGEDTKTASESNILLDLSDVDTSNVTNMSGMFKDCDNITILDLYNFNTEKVEDMSSMFERCSELQCIISPDFATASVTNSKNMFAGCKNLVGGEGTKWIDTKVLDKEYAVVDEGPESSKKGYFTWDAYITYNGGSNAIGSMERESVRRYRKHTLKHNEFRLNNHTFVGWKDDNGNTYKDEAEIAEVSKSINLTAMWSKNGGSNNGPGGGGGGGRGGGNGSGIMQDLDRSVNFVMQTPIYEHEYTWIYDNAGRRVGVNLNVDSTVGKAMIKSVRSKGAYGLNQDGKTMQLGGGGIYRVYYRGREEWFGFDKYNKMMTGFVETSTKTRMLTVATDIVSALVNTESIDEDKIFIETAGQVGKYYLYEQDGDLRGQLWNQPIVINGIQYTFDLTGKVISSTDTPIDQGIWEYNPLEDHWKYFVPDTDGKARYYTDTSFDIYYQGETYKYIFDESGYLFTGYFTWRGKDYYGLESGQFKGAATELTKR